MSEITFDIIRNEGDPDELFRIKHELSDKKSDMHVKLHDGNSAMSKPEILKEINSITNLIEYVDVCIKDVRGEMYIAKKENRFRLRRFKEIARVELSEEVFKKIEDRAKIGME